MLKAKLRKDFITRQFSVTEPLSRKKITKVNQIQAKKGRVKQRSIWKVGYTAHASWGM